MAYCENCGTKISELASACPRCGHPTEIRWNPPPPVIPEFGEPFAPPLAGFAQRFAAALIDSIVMGALIYAFFSHPVTVFTQLGTFVVRQVEWPGTIAAWFVYTWVMLSVSGGRTLGKLALGLRVVTPDGAPVGPARAAVRQAFSVVSFFAIGLGYLWASWDAEKRTWHDLAADTRVFRRRPPVNRA